MNEMTDFAVGTVLLLIASFAYCHVLKTLRHLHNETKARFDTLERLLRPDAEAAMAGHLDTIREAVADFDRSRK